MQLVLKVIAFLAAYAPLLGIYAIRIIPVDWRLSIALALAAVAFPAIVLAYVWSAARNANPEATAASGIVRRDEQIMAYLFTYVLPFVGLAFDDVYELAASGLFLILLFILFVRSNLFYVNPILGAVGYRVYEVEIENAPSRIVLSKEPFVGVGSTLRLVRLVDEDVFLQVGDAR